MKPFELPQDQNTRRGVTVWLAGLSSSDKSMIAGGVRRGLPERGRAAEWLDGDIVRPGLCRGLGFSREDRDENVRRIACVGEILTRHGIVALVSAISPYRQARDQARQTARRFIYPEVHCHTATEKIQECVARELEATGSRGASRL